MRNLIVAICFFLSGGSGLVFETLWTRKLTHVFGSTTLSVASVLTVFMGGLALGSFLLGRYLADRVRRPIVWYGLIEGVVGLWGLLVPVVVDGLYPAVNGFLWNHFEPGYFTFSFLRFLFVALILLPPTTLMGATLPLLSRHFVSDEAGMRRVGTRVGLLYSLNTLGAILGTFAAGFLLLPTLGFLWTNALASGTNLLLCAAVLASYGRRVAEPGPGAVEAEAEAKAEPAAEDPLPFPVGRAAQWTAVIAFGVSGFASMNYQVAWNRLLSMVIGSSVYAFTTILLAFLVGIAGGSALAAWALRRLRNPILWLGLVQLWIGLTAAASYFAADDLPYLFAWLVDRIGGVSAGGASVGLVMLCGFLVAALTVLPSTLGMGATFPLTVRVMATEHRRLGRDVGTLYAVNTLGAILGSFASAFLLVPGLSRLAQDLWGRGYGLQLTVGFSILLNLGLAVALFAATPQRAPGDAAPRPGLRVFRWTAVSFVPALVLLIGGLTLARGWTWDPHRMVAGSFRLAYLTSVLQGPSRADLLYYHDGISTTVSVQRWGSHLALKNNGKVDASNGDDMPTQVLVSGIPLLLHPRGPRELRVAVIGFGSGVSVGAALRLPTARVDVVELEPAVIESSYFFRRENLLAYAPSGDDPDAVRPLLPDPRLRVLSNDGRNFLASTPDRYDVVVSEPSNPWITGVSNLFTLDHFTAARQALAPEGLFCQWVQLYEMSAESVKSILRTFAEAFPHLVVFSAAPGSADTILLGADHPIDLRLPALRALLTAPDVASVLSADRTDLTAAEDLASRRIFASREELLDFTGHAVVNTDDNAFIEFQAPRDLIRYALEDPEIIDAVYGEAWEYGRPTLERLRAEGAELGDPATAARSIHAMVEALLRAGRMRWAGRLVVEAALDEGLRLAPEDPAADDLLRAFRGGYPVPWMRPVGELLRAAAGAVEDPGLAAALRDAAARWREGARPAGTAAALGAAEEAARRRGAVPGLRAAFLLDLARSAVEDAARLAGFPVTRTLHPDWQPLRAALDEPTVAAALDAAARNGPAALADPVGPVLPVVLARARDWNRLLRDPAERRDPDDQAVRLLLQGLLLWGRALGTDSPAGMLFSPDSLRRWKTTYGLAFAPWADDALLRTVPDLPLFDTALVRDYDRWNLPVRLWTYGRIDAVRRDLLARGDPWMEAHGTLLPAEETVAERFPPPPPPPPVPTLPEPAAAPADPAAGGAALDGPAGVAAEIDPSEPAAAATLPAPGVPAAGPPPPPFPDPAAHWAAARAALAGADPAAAAAAWGRCRAAAAALGRTADLEATVSPAAVELALAAAEVRSGRYADAWKRLAPRVTAPRPAGGSAEAAYWAARALHGDLLATAGGLAEEALRDRWMAASLLMDLWVRSGGAAAQRMLQDGVAAIEAPPAEAPPYVPLVSEDLVGGWFEAAGQANRYDTARIARAFLAGDRAGLDAALGGALDAALDEATADSDTGPLADDLALGAFTDVPGGVEALLLFDALMALRRSERIADADIREALDRFEQESLPAGRFSGLRETVGYRFLTACFRLARGDRGPMIDLLSPALEGSPGAGSPLAVLLAHSPAARYHLARLTAGCTASPCRPASSDRLDRALALAGTVNRGAEILMWQWDFQDPYRKVENPVADLGEVVVQGE